MAVNAFVRAGCSRIAFVNSLAGTPSLLKREADFLAAAQKVGVTVQVERFGTTSYESGQILAQRLLTRKVRPDAVYCATDLLACGFMDEARHRFALRIPRQSAGCGSSPYNQGKNAVQHSECPRGRHLRHSPARSAGGSQARGEALAEMSVLQHQILTAPQVGEWLRAAEQQSLNDVERANLNEMQRAYQQATLLPDDFVEAKSIAAARYD